MSLLTDAQRRERIAAQAEEVAGPDDAQRADVWRRFLADLAAPRPPEATRARRRPRRAGTP